MNKQNINSAPERDEVLTDIRHRFAQDVLGGLTGPEKSLPCIYFYDKTGSHLYERICQQPEYYLTRAEAEILRQYAESITKICSGPLRIVELGSGSSLKTRILLEAFIASKIPTTYYPIDISAAILTESAVKMKNAYPQLGIQPIEACYEDGLRMLGSGKGNSLLVWLGSSIGNYDLGSAEIFLSQVSRWLSAEDRMLLGADLIKDPEVLEAAYNDNAGVTASFNLNLLTRINRELGGNFHLEQFKHRAVFNSTEGRIEMYLVSCCEQDVLIRALNQTFSFSRGELIHTENSHKYSAERLRTLGKNAGLNLHHQWFDSEKLFSLNLFESNSAGS